MAKGASKTTKSVSKGAKKFFKSDMRLKENIAKIATVDGVNFYSYNYLNHTTAQTGVMAQELLGTKYKSAVRLGTDGFYEVDYSQLPTAQQ